MKKESQAYYVFPEKQVAEIVALFNYLGLN
jgi:hypothetical protein